MPLDVLASDRLVLVPASAAHLSFLHRLNGDPEVMRHVSGTAGAPAQTEDEWSRRLGPRSDAGRGLGYWVGHVDDEPVGWWGLGVDRTDPTAGELGFRLGRDHWRQGLGAEGATALLRHGFTTVALARIWAGTVTANLASRATLAKVGLTWTAEPAPGVLTYEVTRGEWLAGC